MASVLKGEVLVVVGVALAVIYLSTKAVDTAKEIGKTVLPKIDPTSSDNLAYQGASSIARWLAGREDGTLGDIWYDYVHKGEPLSNAVPDPKTGLTPAYNYTVEQQQADLKAMKQLEAGYHGM